VSARASQSAESTVPLARTAADARAGARSAPERKLRIAMVGQKGVPATYGGIERHVEEISSRLVDRGHRVTVYSRLYYTRVGGTYHGIHLRRLPSINTKHLDTATHTALSTLDAVLRDNDIVHFHALGPSVFSLLPRLRGQKSVVTIHALDWERQKWGKLASWILKKCEYPALHFPTRTVVVSKTLAAYFERKYGISPVVIPNGTSEPVHRTASKIRRFGIEQGHYVLFVGRLVPEKGCHYLLEAFSRMNGDTKLVMAGGSSFSDGYVQDLKKYESSRILFLDYVYGDLLEELWSNAYLVVQPSTLEGLSLSLLEALSYGRCVLTSDIPENLEVVNGNAVSFRSADVEDLKSKMETLLQNPDIVRSYEEKSRRLVRERFSWDHAVDQIEDLYREMVEGRGRAAR
jgi:glycosyltransferase involved in cell wall biosynthesis